MRSVTQIGLTAFLTLSLAAYSQTPTNSPTNSQTNPQSTPPSQTTPTPQNDPQSSTPVNATIPSDVPVEKPIPGHPTATPKESKDAAATVKAENKTDRLPSPGEDMKTNIKPGSEDDVNAVGTRNIGGLGVGKWFL